MNHVRTTEVEMQLQKLNSYTKHALVTIAQFQMLFPNHSDDTIKVRLHQLTKTGFLEKVCRGVWLFPKSLYYKTTDLRYLPHILRKRDINYISLETVLSQYSIISQQMFNYLTVMTTGRSGKFVTSMGTLELTHTKRSPLLLLKETMEVTGVPIREAFISRAWQDLISVGRNQGLVDTDELSEAMAQQIKQLSIESIV